MNTMISLDEVNQSTKSAYNKAAELYDRLFHDELDKKEYDKTFLDKFSKYFNPNSIICDTGCGPCGHVANYLFQKGLNVIGIDISEKCIEIAKNHFPSIPFEVGDFSKLKFTDNYLDGIIAYYSIIDTPKQYVNNVLREFNRVLKNGGILALVVKEGKSEGFQEELLGIETQIYFTKFTRAEIESYLTEIGHDIIMLEKRIPYKDEIETNRIYSISKKV